jgi:hypothetical protein
MGFHLTTAGPVHAGPAMAGILIGLMQPIVTVVGRLLIARYRRIAAPNRASRDLAKPA